MTREGEVEGIGDHRVREDGGVYIVGSGMKVTRGIRLHQDCTSCEERSIRHEQEGMRDIRDTEDGGG